jgi:L-alanine-DL-glutamate epimerase-like enolase superfamily enzyme
LLGQGRSLYDMRIQGIDAIAIEIPPHGTYVECFADPERDPVWQTLWTNRPPIKNGMLEVTQGPGFGLILDEGMVRRYRVS